MNLSRMFDLI